MKVSLNWLKEYVTIEMSTADLAEALTMAGLEVETIYNRYDYLNQVVVGCIRNIEPHPDADKLVVCEVDVGDSVITVVCGAPNAKKEMFAPCALPGTVFPDGTILTKNDIRGVQSEGILCSESELGLGLDRSGILTLSSDLVVGDQLPHALSLLDEVIEIDLTPNRADCLSFIGIAREIAAIGETSITYPEIIQPESSGHIPDGHISDFTSVTIEAPDLCPRYSARLLVDIKVAPSSFWLQDRLISVGLKPINNIVDVTNFVMMETGQPLHTFDFDLLSENRIVVRTANKGETFTTLDQKNRQLSPDMLMICDGEKPIALAGVMGGLNSEIEKSTTRVLIESAWFNPGCIRKAVKKIGLGTDASHRFERGTDPNGTVRALNRAAQLMLATGGGKIIKGIIDEYPKPVEEKHISLSASNTNQILGTKLGQDDIKKHLQSIEFKVETPDNDKLKITIPSFRVDISRQEDLIEEVARLWGYNNIRTTFPMIPVKACHVPGRQEKRIGIKNLMTGFGFYETINYSFMHPLSCDSLRLGPDDPKRKMLAIWNPLKEDQAVMRTSLIPGLIRVVCHNISQQVKNLKIFEIGKVFFAEKKDKLPEEIEMMSGLWTGARFDTSWHGSEANCDFYDMKGVIEGFLQSLKIENLTFTMMLSDACTYTRPGYTAEVYVDKQCIGIVGELHPQVLENFELNQTAFVFDLNLDSFIPFISDVKVAKPIPRFPSVARDITIIVEKGVEAQHLLKSVENMGEKLLEDIILFDVYEGSPIPDGKKSISFRIVYRSPNETLEDEAVNIIHKSVTAGLLKKFNATLPA